MKIGSNDPCHCGSGQKYKRCCAQKDEAARAAEIAAEAAKRTPAKAAEDAEGAPASRQSPFKKSRALPTFGASKPGMRKREDKRED